MNEHGGIQPPDHLIDSSDIPEIKSFAGWKKGGLPAMYQETLERRKHKEMVTAAPSRGDNRDPDFFYGGMPPIRDFSEGVYIDHARRDAGRQRCQ